MSLDSSATIRATAPGSQSRRTLTLEARACRITFVMASWAIRKIVVATHLRREPARRTFVRDDDDRAGR